MKTSLQFFLLMCICALSFTNCDGRQPQAVEPESYVTIVKFTNPSYINNLIVTDYGGDNLFLMKGNLCEHTHYISFPEKDVDGTIINGDTEFNFPERIRNPFWELPDGWYLIDWAWYGLSTAYPYDGNTILTETNFQNYRENPSSEFDKSIPHISFNSKKDIFDARMINIADLMAYSYPDGNYPSYEYHYFNKNTGVDTTETIFNQYFYHKKLCHTRPVSNITNCLCEIADEMDKYWSLLQEQIAELIQNGDLDKLKEFDVDQLYLTIKP